MGDRRLCEPGTLLLAVAAGLFAIHALVWRGSLIDDAYISLRYASHLAEGHGLVWNVGERVEGYTNFLWVLLGAVFLRSGVGAIAALQTLSLLATLATLALTARLARLTGGSGPVPAVVWLLAAEGFAYYATTGMETALFTALTATALVLGLGEARDGRWRGSVLAFLVLTLTRPDGALLFVVSQGVFSFVEHQRRSSWGLQRRAIDTVVYVLGIGTWIGWRLFYYGELLPNTFHAKVTGGSEQFAAGLLTLVSWSLSYPLFALALLAPAFLLLRPSWRRKIASPELLAIWSIALAWAFYVLAIGGDTMPFHRFLMPLLPLVAVVTSRVLLAIKEIWPWLEPDRRTFSIVVILLLGQVVAGRLSQEPMRAFVAHRTTIVGLETGRYLEATRAHDDLLAVNTAGALPWASRLPSLDMLGLTEPAIARRNIYVVSPRWTGHRRGWGEHVLSRQPAVIVWYNSAGSREPHYMGDHELADHPAFRFFYQRRSVDLPAAGDAGRVLARFRGAPFGEYGGQSSNLGVVFEIRSRPWTHTLARGAPIVFHHFERRRDLEALWPIYQKTAGDLDSFLDAAIQQWKAAPKDFDPKARQEVEQLCAEALVHVQAGRDDLAKELLSHAAELNGRGRSPLLGQYVANLAVQDNDLFLAVQAQIEALRLAPNNALYRSNLHHLLTVPWEDLEPGSSLGAP